MFKREFKFHGILAKVTGCESVKIEAETLRGAIKALTVLFPKIKTDWPCVQFHGFDTMDRIEAQMGDRKTIDVFPAFMVGKKSGFLQVIVGVALIATAIAFPELSVGLGIFGTLNATTLAVAGATLLAGGLLQLLAPTPTIDNASTAGQDNSFILAATQNTVASGTRITKAYGTIPLFGQFLSFNVDAKDRATNAPTGDGSNGGIGPGVYGNFQIL